nr:tpr and ankyrin repeat-containing protein 1 [Quercus suber]
MEGECSKKKKPNKLSLIDVVFSWCLEDVLNEDLYMNKVEKIPESFQSVQQYFGSFIFSLLDETRAELSSSLDSISSAPYAGVNSLQECGECVYDVKVDQWMYKSSSSKPYKMFPGDILVFTDSKPQTISDLKQEGGTWTLALVTEGICTEFKVKASCCIEVHKPQFVVFLRNITTNRNIWNALHTFGNLSIVKEVLYTNNVAEENCSLCSGENDFIQNEEIYTTLLFKLNDSQREAVLASLHKFQCYHKSSVELIWCPPGTGKTMTLSILLFILQRMSCRTLVCAPTNVAITEAACHLLKLVKASSEAGSVSDALLCSLGNILFLGSEDLLEVASDIEEIHLNYRVERLLEVLGPLTGLRHCSCSMIDFLEGCVSQYHIFMDGELMEKKEHNIVKNYSKGECKTFLEYVIERFRSIALLLRSSISIFCTHIARSCILDHNFETMVSIMKLLDTFETLLSQNNINSEELLVQFSHAKNTESCHNSFNSISTLLNMKRGECIYILKVLLTALDALDLPSAMDPSSVKKFCFQTSSLIFCTASSSHMLHSLNMKPLEFLVIDESAQLKECELIIPLQLPGLRHAILFGDHCQLPAMVNSNVSARAGFGRSLFERLSLMGHSKHFLNIQYRMHPLISFFPNSKFYGNKIVDAPNVKSGLAKRYLPGQIFGSYSFINISCGIEELDGVHHSWKNMVEVAVIIKLVNNLYKEWNGSKQKLSIGVISPYTAQVIAVQEKIGKKYKNLDGFAVKVKSIAGFQGGKADIIILSTVRCNSDGSISFASNHGRINVALTRARHCLWILGNETTLLSSQSVWKSIVCDAKDRQCFYSADEDENLAKLMLEVKRELNEYDDLLNFDSILFKSARWKVLFSDCFRKSFKKLRSIEKKELVINLLLRLSSGWRPKNKKCNLIHDNTSGMLKQFKVKDLYIICSVDVMKESWYIQVLKVWDILPLEDIPKLAIRLDALFGKYTNDYLNRCKAKCFDGDLEVPMSWVTSLDFVRYKNSSYNGDMADSDDVCFGRRTFVENSMVSDSLTLMKFYSLSSGVVSHLLSRCDGKELDFPFELSEQETEVILFDRSCFILGRSGTGKTTVLTTKLFQKEQLHHIASEGFHEPQSCSTVEIFPKKEDGERVGGTKGAVLHQIFVTANPKLCYAIKQRICHLKRFACVGDASEGSTPTGLDEIDEMLQFKDIPDSFIDLPTKLYPLVLTFHKFLMMLDGTVGNSFFRRFPEAIGHSHGRKRASKSVALKTFIRTKEVNYERFRSSYWPRFNNEQTKKFDSSTVFTEIMSYIKGGLPAGESCDDKLGLEDYLLLAERRVSTLSRQEREIIFDIFLQYERKKMKRGEFDLADLVIDIHNRLKVSRYDGDNMDFVYIDEVQDLSMRQVALFKYLCKNVAEGFVFSGDTAQTIARGIDFRFQDIKFLFYKEFLLGSGNDGACGKKKKEQIADVFQLSQNFRTHAGILNLAQSVINLIYHFFPLSIDTLRPETSLIDGQVPVLLKSVNGENAFISIFKNGGNDDGKIIGFGADQVILVRDDLARNEIVDYVGNQALILTIMESKGLEFR